MDATRVTGPGRSGATASPDVSIVVPAFDALPELERCLASIEGLRFPSDQLEVILVDDGSTDGTAERLEAFAAGRSDTRVIRLPPTGGPGGPRNAGIAEARGEYLQFLDADDELTPDSIARLLAIARRNDSDIVLPKFASAAMARRQDLFDRSQGRTSLAAEPRIADGSLGPWRFFRTAFLREHGLAFPEGWRYLEDQAFMLRALLAARRIAIDGDETSYLLGRRGDDANLSAQPLDPLVHARHLSDILALIRDGTRPGTLRDRLVRRLYRVEVLERLAGPAFLTASSSERAALVAALAPIARELVDPSTPEALGAIAAVRSSLLARGRVDDLAELARREAGLDVLATVQGLRWEGDALVGRWTAVLVGPDGSPVPILRTPAGPRLDPAIADDLVGSVPTPDEAAGLRARVSLLQPGSMREWLMDPGAALRLDPDATDPRRIVPRLEGSLAVRPTAVGPGPRPLEPGEWDLVVRWAGFGIRRTASLRPWPGAPLPGPARFEDPPTLVTAGSGGDAGIRLTVANASGDGSRSETTRIHVVPAPGRLARIGQAARRVARDRLVGFARRLPGPLRDLARRAASGPRRRA